MTDRIEDAFEQTAAVMTELVAKAREGAAAGESRRAFFTRTAKLAGTTALGLAGVGLVQPIAAAAADPIITESFQDIINLAATAESLATTFYVKALDAGSSLPTVNNDANKNYFQAAAVQEFDHLHYLTTLGATPVQTQFYFPEGMFTDESVFFPTAGLLEDYFISAYIAAAIEFSGAVSSGITTASPFGIGLAVQVAGVECEHRALLRVAENLNPPNNRIVESALLKDVSAVVGPLTPFLTGGSGYSGPYAQPTRGAVNTAAEPYGFSFFPTPKYV